MSRQTSRTAAGRTPLVTRRRSLSPHTVAPLHLEPSSETHMQEPIAIVGCGCVLPDARSPAQFWDNTLAQHCAVRPLRGGVWDWESYGDASGTHPDPESQAAR